VAGTPLRPHLATPTELRDRLRAEAAGAPFLVLRATDDDFVVDEAALEHGGLLTIGRDEATDVALAWDARVSRTHATLERLGSDWTISDDGLSRNGTWVNEERVTARRRLRDGDVVRVGGTSLAFCAPGPGARADVTLTAEGVPVGDVLTSAQRRVLVALCRPYRDAAFATPASNPAIARASVSVDAVKSTMRALFDLFGIGDSAESEAGGLAPAALRGGVFSRRDL
jgi:pSer/pThr/pTyr-binding forkhead associated (FHA) protein